MMVARSAAVVPARRRTCGQDRSVKQSVGVARQTQARLSQTRVVKTEHLVARTFFLSLVVSSTRTPEHIFNDACTRGSGLHKSLCTCDVWSVLPHCASKTPLPLLCLIPIFSVSILARSPPFSLHHHSRVRQHAQRNQRGHR